jgi:hypothetical protein
MAREVAIVASQSSEPRRKFFENFHCHAGATIIFRLIYAIISVKYLNWNYRSVFFFFVLVWQRRWLRRKTVTAAVTAIELNAYSEDESTN